MNQLPAHLQRLAGRNIGSTLLALGGSSVPHISIRMNRFTLVDAAGNKQQPANPLQLDVVICDTNPHKSKLYYSAAFDPSAEDYAPPTCYSDNGEAPSAQAQEPQSPTCASCKWNVWGSSVSKVTGKNTKACNDAMKIAVFRPEDPHMLFLLRIPPASLKLLGSYVKSLVGNNAAPEMVITRITFDEQTQGVLNFAALNWIDEPTAARVEEVQSQNMAADLVGKNDIPYRGQIAGGTAPVQIAAPAQQMAPPPTLMQQPAAQPAPLSPFPAVQDDRGIPQGEFPGSQQPEKRKRRTKAEMEAERQPIVQTAAAPLQAAPFMPASQQAAPFMPQPVAQPMDDPLAIPAFLKRDAGATQPQQTTPTLNQYGMQPNAPAPDQGLQDALSRALNLPTG